MRSPLSLCPCESIINAFFYAPHYHNPSICHVNSTSLIRGDIAHSAVQHGSHERDNELRNQDYRTDLQTSYCPQYRPPNYITNKDELVELACKSDFDTPPAIKDLDSLKLEGKALRAQMGKFELKGTEETWERQRLALLDRDQRRTNIWKRIRTIAYRREQLEAIEETRDKIYSKLFERDFTADPTRKSFLDLSREIRDICYTYAFEDVKAIKEVNYEPKWDRLKPAIGNILGFGEAICALQTLSTLNVLIRQEARATFWSMSDFHIAAKAWVNTYPFQWDRDAPRYMALAERCLRGIGDSGRFGLKVFKLSAMRCCINCENASQDITEAVHITFKNASRMLLDCVSLTKLQLTVSEHYLLRNDITALEDFFLHGKTLKSSGLQSFQGTLQALPLLQEATIDMPYVKHESDYEEDFDAWEDMAPFLRYAFTCERRRKLCITIRNILEKTKLQLENGFVHVDLEKGVLDDQEIVLYENDEGYEEWLSWENRFVPGGYERWLKQQHLL